MNPTEIKRIFAEIGGSTRKQLGQHLLVDETALKTVVEASIPDPKLLTLEVGPGLGVLTRALIDHGCAVTAIERDRRFVEYLTRTLLPLTRGDLEGVPSSLTIVAGDAADISWEKVIGRDTWQLIANLPYAITSLALRKAFTNILPPINVVVLVQKEVADRALAKDGKTSLLSLMVSLYTKEAKILRRVPPGAFFPPPKVDSAIVQFLPFTVEERMKKWECDPEDVMKYAKKGFAHPRKLLSSNLGIKPEVLEGVGIAGKTRAEDVSAEQWVKLFLSI